MVDKGMIDAINKLRGIGGSPNDSKKEQKTNNTVTQPSEPVQKGAPENIAALNEFLNSASAEPTEQIEKKYTMEDLNNFIEGLVKK